MERWGQEPALTHCEHRTGGKVGVVWWEGAGGGAGARVALPTAGKRNKRMWRVVARVKIVWWGRRVVECTAHHRPPRNGTNRYRVWAGVGRQGVRLNGGIAPNNRSGRERGGRWCKMCSTTNVVRGPVNVNVTVCVQCVETQVVRTRPPTQGKKAPNRRPQQMCGMPSSQPRGRGPALCVWPWCEWCSVWEKGVHSVTSPRQYGSQ